MSSWLKGQLGELTTAVRKTVVQTRNKTLLEAIVAAFALVAHASGAIKPEEKAKFMGFIEHSEILSTFDPDSIEQLLQDCERQYAFDTQVAETALLQTVAKIKQQPAQARLLVRICIAVASADGDFDATERELVSRICQVLDLNPADFDLATPPAQAAAGNPAPSRVNTTELQRGGRISLSQLSADLQQLTVELGWSKRFRNGIRLDIDASVFLLDADGKVRSDGDFVFYNQPRSRCGSIALASGSDDRAQFDIDLARVPSEVQRIAFVATLHQAERHSISFAQVEDTFIRLSDPCSGRVLVQYSPGRETGAETALIFGELYRHRGEWRFSAVGQGFFGGLQALCERFGVSTDS